MSRTEQRYTRSGVLSLSIMGGVILLSGCATLSKQECLVGNWQAIGYNDGVAGYHSERLAAHAKACAKANITPDYSAWERGRQLGLQQYCTTNNAYNLGRRGRKLNNVCPMTAVNSLQIANQQGLDYYTLERQIEDDNRRLDEYQEELDRLKDGEMLDFDSEKEARKRLLYLSSEQYDIKRRIKRIQRQLDALSQTDRPYR